MTSSPIFIAGPDRSGTTLLYAILASHPNISMVRRTNFWRWFYGRYGDLEQQENFEHLLQRMLSYKRIEPLAPDGKRIREEYLQGTPGYGRLFALFNEHNAIRQGKTRWGDKSLHTEHYIDTVIKEFPQAKIIHTIRDPRDRYASIRKRFGGDNPRLGASTISWLSSINAARRNIRKYPENYLIIRFEDLVSEPEETTRKFCQFIGEAYHPEMLSMQGATRYKDSGGNSSFEKIAPGEISKKPVGRYKKVLTGAEIAFIQWFTKKIMQEFDYPLEKVQLSFPEKLKFYLWIFPSHLIRMTGWLALKFLYQDKPKVPENRFLETPIINKS